ncbi:MAG TPA: bifunctional (p)ppGpp synthetase/guanosine-3',5'-bis(diphosphate) 3'-pyrophosphohydrolase [Candidatus Binataceae bacterium]|nr:bifunctional (p)ppGpp synthetase/guanosine-3',5'-bis(diphosphate) 3'-pyrophosphohydrolase [Candidatus Binataceae bacterium]
MASRAPRRWMRAVEALELYPDQLDQLIHRVQEYIPHADGGLIKRAYEFSATKHGEQKRMSGEPYVIHPLNVALIVARLKLDVPSVVTGLLHDIIEDTPTTLADIQNVFGAEIAQLVDGLTKVSKITFQSREEKQAENFRKMIIAMAHDIRVVLIKLADRLHNMQTLNHLSGDRQLDISRETLEIYAPIAHRLGIYWLKSELEDAAFRYVDPVGYKTLREFVAKTKAEREEYIKAVIQIISQRMKEAGVKAEVTGRPKHFYSIMAKMEREDLAFDQVYDLVAFRVIVGTVRECYEALGVVHANWKPVPGRFKDYIALPKPNMYQSLHTTMIGPRGERMEVQIRTREMHQVAEEGIAAHWNYKEGNGGGLRDSERFAWLRRLIEWQQNLKDPQEFLSTVKEDLFPEEVFVFTPKGDLLDFPPGATVIDFAYRIHSQVGHHLTGARVNGRMVPLRYKLRSGDVVEVITSEKQHPGKDWLNCTITARAKSRIRQWLRSQQAERSLQLGQELLDHELAPIGLTVAQLRREGRLDAAAKEFSNKDADSVLAAVGYGMITAAQLLAKALKPEELKLYRAEKQPASGAKERAAKDAHKTTAGGVMVSGVGDVLVRFARCCNPLPGEGITGFITRGRGVTVHLIGCPRALESDPQRRVSLVWSEGEGSPRPIRLEVICLDQPGLLAGMSKAIASVGVNISSAEVKSTGVDGRALSVFELSVSNARQLNAVMQALRATDGVLRVARLGDHNGSNPE